uniref:Irl1 n=1 Tax=Arundo donax TaxID=35708 RepID=A0A0A8ZBG8_ARUDO
MADSRFVCGRSTIRGYILTETVRFIRNRKQKHSFIEHGSQIHNHPLQTIKLTYTLGIGK